MMKEEQPVVEGNNPEMDWKWTGNGPEGRSKEEEDIQGFGDDPGVKSKTRREVQTQSMKGNMETTLIFQMKYWKYLRHIYTNKLIVNTKMEGEEERQ